MPPANFVTTVQVENSINEQHALAQLQPLTPKAEQNPVHRELDLSPFPRVLYTKEQYDSVKYSGAGSYTKAGADLN